MPSDRRALTLMKIAAVTGEKGKQYETFRSVKVYVRETGKPAVPSLLLAFNRRGLTNAYWERSSAANLFSPLQTGPHLLWSLVHMFAGPRLLRRWSTFVEVAGPRLLRSLVHVCCGRWFTFVAVAGPHVRWSTFVVVAGPHLLWSLVNICCGRWFTFVAVAGPHLLWSLVQNTACGFNLPHHSPSPVPITHQHAGSVWTGWLRA
ncbi:hypothetical protein Btru_026142, partial [Bulinus truncatus]